MKKLYTIILFAFVGTIANAQYTKLLDFAGATNGSYPLGSLISDGTYLYGATNNGGTNNMGTIFKIKPDGSAYSKLLDFDFTNGSSPLGSLIFDGTFLYGMTHNGDIGSCTDGCGVLFKIKPDGTGYSKLHTFSGAPDGALPAGSLISDGNFLYGMTWSGGTGFMGVLFKIKPDGTGYTHLIDFSIAAGNGIRPTGDLISDGTFLYGMTNGFGTTNLGTIFKIKSDGTGYSKLMDFTGTANGRYPFGSLISDGTFLYGMTYWGGTNDLGTIFKIKPDGTGYSKLLDFAGGVNGRYPVGSLISDGTFLYGMTENGGTNDMGIVFKIKTDGTKYTKLLDFDFTNTAYGKHPKGSLTYDGTFLYGMTTQGGTNDMGTIFKINPLGMGISENNAATSFTISPNPFSTQTTLQANKNLQNATLTIYNSFGQTVKQIKNINGQTIVLSRDNLASGLYFVRLTEDGKTFATEKLIITDK